MELETKFKETEEGLIPSDWEIKKLKDLIEIKYGKDHKNLAKGKIPCYGTGGVMRFVEKEIYNKESVLIPRKGSLNNIYYVNKPFWTVDTLFWTKINVEKVVPRYLYYRLKLFDFASQNLGSAVPSMTVSFLNEINIIKPSLEEQKAIAKILSDLDEKIEINRKINENLEELGQTLFKRWFIDFEFPNEDRKSYKSSGGELIESELGEIPKGWKVDKLGNYVNSINGYSYKGVELQPSNDALVTLKNFDRTGGFRYDGFKEVKGSYKEIQKVVAGDLVVAHTDLTTNAEVLGNPIIVPKSKYENMIISMDLVKVVPMDDTLSITFLYFLMRNYLFKGHCLGYSNGTTVLHLKKTAIPKFEFIVPDKEVMKKYSELTSNIIGQIIDLTEELQSLQQIRDSLLPKLMSGQIRVK